MRGGGGGGGVAARNERTIIREMAHRQRALSVIYPPNFSGILEYALFTSRVSADCEIPRIFCSPLNYAASNTSPGSFRRRDVPGDSVRERERERREGILFRIPFKNFNKSPGAARRRTALHFDITFAITIAPVHRQRHRTMIRLVLIARKNTPSQWDNTRFKFQRASETEPRVERVKP